VRRLRRRCPDSPGRPPREPGPACWRRRGGARPAPEHLSREEDPAVDDEEDRRRSRIAEQRLQWILKQEADDPRGDRPDHQHDREALIRIVDAPPHRGADESSDDPHPVAAVQEEERCGGPDVEKSEHRDERRAGFVEVEPDQAGDNHRVAQRGHRKKLGDSLERGEEEDESGAQHWPEPTSPLPRSLMR